MFKQKSTTPIYKNPWLSLREDIIERPNGEEGLFGIIEKPNFAAVVAVQDGHIYLVEQYRYAINLRSLELPMGTWPNHLEDTGSTEALALAELKEETGYHADHIEPLGFHYVDKATSTHGGHIFFASQLTFVGQALEDEEADLKVTILPISEFEAKIINGDVVDAATIAAYGLAKLCGKV